MSTFVSSGTTYINGSNGPFNSGAAVGKSANAGYESANLFSQNPQATDNLSISWLNKNNGSSNFDLSSGFAYCYESDAPLNPSANGTVSVAQNEPSLAAAFGDKNGNMDLAHQFALCELQNEASSGSVDGKITTQGIDEINELAEEDPSVVKSTLNKIVKCQNLETKSNLFLQGMSIA